MRAFNVGSNQSLNSEQIWNEISDNFSNLNWIFFHSFSINSIPFLAILIHTSIISCATISSL